MCLSHMLQLIAQPADSGMPPVCLSVYPKNANGFQDQAVCEYVSPTSGFVRPVLFVVKSLLGLTIHSSPANNAPMAAIPYVAHMHDLSAPHSTPYLYVVPIPDYH